MKPYVFHSDNGDIAFEWIAPTRRFGISIDHVIEDSSWFYVNKDGTMECGELPEELLKYFKTEPQKWFKEKLSELATDPDFITEEESNAKEVIEERTRQLMDARIEIDQLKIELKQQFEEGIAIMHDQEAENLMLKDQIAKHLLGFHSLKRDLQV